MKKEKFNKVDKKYFDGQNIKFQKFKEQTNEQDKKKFIISALKTKNVDKLLELEDDYE